MVWEDVYYLLIESDLLDTLTSTLQLEKFDGSHASINFEIYI